METRNIQKILYKCGENEFTTLGFVVRESNFEVHIAASIGSKGYTDISKIKKDLIVSRKNLLEKTE